LLSIHCCSSGLAGFEGARKEVIGYGSGWIGRQLGRAQEARCCPYLGFAHFRFKRPTDAV
jgi:hypothetical protein